MDPLSGTASILTIIEVLGKAFDYLKNVKDAPKELKQCEIEFNNLRNLLHQLHVHIETGGPNQPWYTAVRELEDNPDGPLQQYKKALEEFRAKTTSESRLKQLGKVLVWKFTKEDIASILDRTERLKMLVEIALQLDHFKLSQAIRDDTKLVRTHIPDIQSKVDKIQQDQDNARHTKLVEWISPTDYPAQQSDIIGRRQNRTGQWFLDAPEFTAWLGEPSGILFCPGIPGAGKTMIAAIAIEHLLTSVQNSSIGVSYVYCNYKDEENQSISSLLAVLVKQLVQTRPLIAGPVERLHQKHADRGTKPSFDEILGVFKEVLAEYSTVYIVVDALDECQDGTRRQLLAELHDLRTGHDIRLMATARFIPEIGASFGEAAKLEVRASDEDVRRFVAGQMHRLPRCIRNDSALQDMIQDKFVDAADGMFLLARLYTDSLLDKRTVKEVKSTLARLSRGLDTLKHAYDEAIRRIESQLDSDKERAKNVLSWITYARRPLTTPELCHALAVEPGKAELDPENIPNIEDLLSVCAGLVIIDQESAVIRLIHYTAQDYFEDIRDTWNPTAQLQIASTCLTYLLFDIFRTGSCSSDEDLEKKLRENEFLEYAAKYWGEHAVTAESDICELARTFLSRDDLISSAEQAILSNKSSAEQAVLPNSQAYTKGNTGLHLTARFGLSLILEAMLLDQAQEKIVMLEKRNGRGQTPLFLAALFGHDTTVKLLIQNGANVNAQDEDSRSALQEALREDHKEVARLLLENGAEGC